MTSPNVPAQLETALDELDMADKTLNQALNDALHSALHSTYTAAIDRILTFNVRTIKSTQNLIRTLKPEPSATKH